MNNAVIECEHVSKQYHDGMLQVQVLQDINFSIAKGEQVAIVGPSGSGKSTLLHILGGLDGLSSGRIMVLGEELWQLTEVKRCYLRNHHLGFVYQFHHLLPEFTALENVMMPLLIAGYDRTLGKQQASELLTHVGLGARLQHKPAQLSGGERQRTAIARALVMKPSCLLADEPTGNLDQKTAEQVYGKMLQMNRELGTSLLIATHDERLAAKMDRILRLENGILVPTKTCSDIPQ